MSNETKTKEPTLSNLLMHWWHYYGKCIYTYGELQKFLELLKKDEEKILDVAVASYIMGDGPTILLMAIRNNEVEKLYDVLPNKSSFNSTELKDYNYYKSKFLEKIKDSYIKNS